MEVHILPSQRYEPDHHRYEREVIDQLKSGDPEAFRILVAQNQNKVINLCFRLLNNREDAEDAAQETFIEIFRSIANFREESLLSTWIYRIAVSKSLDYRRKKQRAKRLGILKRIFGTDEEEEEIPENISSNPEVIMENSERARILREAVNAIPENQKIAITLREYENFSNNEIASIMGVSVSSVESLLHRARKNLYKKLYNYFDKNLI